MTVWYDAIIQGDLETINRYLKDGTDPSEWDNEAIRMASKHGHFEVVKLLLNDERIDPSAENNYAIRVSSANSHVEVVKLLLKDESVFKYQK